MLSLRKLFIETGGWGLDRQTKKLAELLSLKRDGDIAYGFTEEFPLLLLTAPASRVLVVSAVFLDQGKRNEALTAFSQEAFLAENQVSCIAYDRGSFSFHFQTSHVPLEAIRVFAAALPQTLRALDAKGREYCGICGEELGERESGLLLYRGSARSVHPACADTAIEEMERPATENKPLRLARGVPGALIGALPGAILFVIASNLGWSAALLGAAIGYGAQKGYDMLGGRPGKTKLAVVFLVSFVFVALSILTAFYVSLGDYYLASGGRLTPEAFFQVLSMGFSDAAFLGVFVEDMLIGLLTAMLGAMNAVRQLFQKKAKERGMQVRRLEPSKK